jgi:hypothetical protein
MFAFHKCGKKKSWMACQHILFITPEGHKPFVKGFENWVPQKLLKGAELRWSELGRWVERFQT